MRLLLPVLLFAAFGAVAQDYDREKRWASEVVSNLVVGDAVQHTGREKELAAAIHEFLARLK